MRTPLHRRTLLLASLAALALPACETIPGVGLDEAVRRLLALSSERAFARLTQENGFFADEIARIELPEELGGRGASSAAAAALLRTPAVQERLLLQVNRAAELGARAAAPVVRQAIRDLVVVDADAVVRGGPTAATDYLQRSLGAALFEAVAPGVGEGLRLFDSEIVTQALQAATGINAEGLRLDIARRASDAIYRAIGREEAAIRADPSALASALGGLRIF